MTAYIIQVRDCESFSRKMGDAQFEYINRVYWDSFGPSKLDAFLDDSPPKNRVFLWHLRRWTARIFVFVFYPIFIFIEVWGIITEENHSLKEVSFAISLLCHNVQNFLKMGFWLTHLATAKSLCLDFSKSHIARHRPKLTSWVLEKESRAVRKLVGRCYMISYANIIFWFVLPTSMALYKYTLYLTGTKEPQATYIPRYSPCSMPFDQSYMSNRIIIAILEIPVFSLAFVYFQPIDMFYATVINMAQAQFKALNSAMFTMPDELSEFWMSRVPVEDTHSRMDMRLFIEDHQFMIRYGILLRKSLNPILGLVTFNCITIICNMTIVAKLQFSEEAEFLDLLLPSTASILVVLTCVYVFYTYSSMCGVLKDAEESVFHALYASKWFEKNADERKVMIFMQKQSRTARRIKMFGLGDMGRYTFVDGLRMVYSYYQFMQHFK